MSKMPPAPLTDPHKVVPIDKIRRNGGTQARDGLNEATVEDYAEAMLAGAVFPPVTVYHDGDVYWLADGFHRVAAASRAQFDAIHCKVVQGNQREAVLYACGANHAHGLRRTREDKRRAVQRLLGDAEWGQWSNREIAGACAVSESLVRTMRKESSPHLRLNADSPTLDDGSDEAATLTGPTVRKVRRGGTEYEMQVGGIAEAARARAAEAVDKQAPATAAPAEPAEPAPPAPEAPTGAQVTSAAEAYTEPQAERPGDPFGGSQGVDPGYDLDPEGDPMERPEAQTLIAAHAEGGDLRKAINHLRQADRLVAKVCGEVSPYAKRLPYEVDAALRHLNSFEGSHIQGEITHIRNLAITGVCKVCKGRAGVDCGYCHGRRLEGRR